MSNCKTIQPVSGCLTAGDGTQTPISIHYSYGFNAAGNEIVTAVRYTDSSGVPIAPAATDTVTPGACLPRECRAMEACACVDDGTGTSTNEVVTVQFGVYCDDGSFVGWFRRTDDMSLLPAEPMWVDCCDGSC